MFFSLVSRSLCVIRERHVGDLHVPGAVLGDAQHQRSVVGHLRSEQQVSGEHRLPLPHDQIASHVDDGHHVPAAVHGHHPGS